MSRFGARAAAVVLACSLGLYLVLSLSHPLFHPFQQLGFFDLKVYRGGGRLVLDGLPLYDTRIGASHFTYPPAAAVAFAPLAVIPLAAAAPLWLEPVTTTLAYGQIDLLIATLILYDLSRPDGARWKGAAIGL